MTTTTTPIVPNPMAQINLGIFNAYVESFSQVADIIFKYNGDADADFISKLTLAKQTAQGVNDTLPKLIAALNDYPVTPSTDN
jgi:uncharacterized protein YukE